MRHTVCSGTHEAGMNTMLEQVRTIADSHHRFHVLLTMPDGTYRTIMNATAGEHYRELCVYADATVLFSLDLDRDGLLYPTRADRLPMLGLDALPVKFEPFPPREYPIMRLADGQSFPIREIPIMKGPTVRVNVPDHGYRIITTSNIVCIDLP